MVRVIARPAVRLAYRGQQTSLQYACALVQILMRRLVLRQRPRFTARQARSVRERFFDLIERDLANAEAGLYPRSLLFQIPLRSYVRELPALARDVPRVLGRMRTGDYEDLPPDVDLSRYPPYYRRNFHWQSDGYLSRHSARLYDVGVEFLFGGTADVMRRQVIPPVTRFVGGRRGRARILDVACGTGRTLAQLRKALPDCELSGIDLSRFYLDEARRHLDDAVSLVEGNAEALPMDDHSVDVVTSVFLFHELPRNARRQVLREMYRVLRPGGLLVLLDSVQYEDAQDIIYFLDRFAREMHEPFYQDYVRDTLADAAAEVGFEIHDRATQAFMAKVVVARKPTD